MMEKIPKSSVFGLALTFLTLAGCKSIASIQLWLREDVMKYKRMKSGVIIVTAILWLCVAGCGGSKILKEPEPLVVAHPLATASDQRLCKDSANMVRIWACSSSGKTSMIRSIVLLAELVCRVP